MYHFLPVRSWVFVIWAVLVSVALYARPLLPVDETRYAAVAWEMWLRNDFLVPHLNGELYSHKPPLLFWLMQLTWLLFGVNDWSLRLVSPLFALGTVYLTSAIARLLWPERKTVADMAPIMLLGSGFWIVFSTLTMFDMMLAFFVALGIYSLLKLADAGLTLPRWLLLGAAVGGGVLSKGPVVLLHLLPVALAAPWWHRELRPGSYWRLWYAGLAFSILLGAAIALCWALPAGMAGGEVYRNAIFWGQTQGRLVESFAHRLPWWWYAQFMPAVLLPWLLMKPIWQGLKTLNPKDAGLRFCAAWGVPLFIVFSAISGKRIHYLLPMFPLLVLVLAKAAAQADEGQADWRRAHQWVTALLALLGGVMAATPWIDGFTGRNPELSALSPLWGTGVLLVAGLLWRYRAQNAPESVFAVSTAIVISVLSISSAVFSVIGERFDTRPIGTKIAEVLNQGKEVAYMGAVYHGEYIFTGRLTKPVKVFHVFPLLDEWMPEHPDDYLLMRFKRESDLPARFPYYRHRYKNTYMAVVPIREFLEHPELKKILYY
ncbi:ArnT family glycosyltransferase [Candidatus Methylomicrobium oryzae]|uniref:ArnT family glycosyltransferase n=1 Tax=Candidatus Methylomicrobium oryzae TaxID=2802053 RepID=UPI0019216CF6|nr:glycosyltransferase family 39 protein [Methylomicrobium sp. RS1]MBL1264846.1 glycosyltransferase family 39 protein [Methylomicrobium sp. RS1]